jgi:hypothetical protein
MQQYLTFITKHKPTNGQVATARQMGFAGINVKTIEFGGNPVEQLVAVGIYPGSTIAVVAPLFVSLMLLRAGYTIVDFVNEPSARQRGVFVCRGAWVHTLQESAFVPCPIPLEAQEESALA